MRPLLSYRESADRFTLATVSETMKQQFGLIQRPWGVYYLKNKVTGEQTSLKTRDKREAERLLQAHNDTESQPHFNLALARVYINGADPKLIHGKASMAKLFCSEAANRCADRSVQIFGGRGYMRTNVAERFWRELRVDRIWEGTSEIQRLIVARSLERRGVGAMLG